MKKVLKVHTLDGKHKYVATNVDNSATLKIQAQKIATEAGAYYETRADDFGYIPVHNIGLVEQVDEEG